MAGWRQAVEVAMTDEEVARLMAISRSRTEPASRVERAQMLLAYREKPSFFAVGQRLGVHHQTVERCIERARAYGPLMALDDRPRPGKEPMITPEAKAWLVSLACDKAKDHGYPHELWTTRLFPVPGEQLVQLMAFGSPGNDTFQHVGQVGLRIEIVELCCVHDRRQDRPALGATFAAAEQ